MWGCACEGGECEGVRVREVSVGVLVKEVRVCK